MYLCSRENKAFQVWIIVSTPFKFLLHLTFLKILTLPFFTSSLFLPSFFSSYITHLHFLLVELLLLCCGCFCRGALLLWLIICYIEFVVGIVMGVTVQRWRRLFFTCANYKRLCPMDW